MKILSPLCDSDRAWVTRKQLLDQCLDLQLFNREAEAAESWMAKREAFLATEELGDSLDAVEGLIKKHEDMDKSLQAQASTVLILTHSYMTLIQHNVTQPK